MRFNRAALLAYDHTLFQGVSIADLVSKPIERFPMSGLRDLREVLLITEEYFSNYPTLEVQEKADGEVDKVFLETVGRDTFSRALQMRVFVEQTTPQHRRERYGETVLRPTVFSFATSLLSRQDYWPSPGDRVRFNNQLYDITRAYVDPKDYFGQTTFPLYVRCDTRVANQDSRDLGNLCGTSGNSLASPGAPSSASPSDSGPSSGAARYDHDGSEAQLPDLVAPQ